MTDTTVTDTAIEKILVALDDSPASERVFEEALTLAKQKNAQLILLHVLSTDERDSSALTCLIPYSNLTTREDLVKFYRVQRQRAEEQGMATLKQFASQARDNGVAVRFVQSIGNPRELICHTACMWQADLIVMGRRNHSRLSEWWTGSVSKHVSHTAPCAVRVVQCQEKPGRPSYPDRWQMA
jgi:nucleotide-binding universal stress UspA family protein